VLVHLRARVVKEEKSRLSPETAAMGAAGRVFSSRARYERAQKLSRLGRGPLRRVPLPGWSAMRDLPQVPKSTFREWRRERSAG
jgi:L-lactate dehydrogenase complex protein LldF